MSTIREKDNTGKRIDPTFYFEDAHAPSLLYKYRAVNQYSLSIIEHASLYLSSPKHLNDPYDSQIDLKSSIIEAIELAIFEYREVGYRDVLLVAHEKLLGMADSGPNGGFESFGICSFSTDPAHPLMWAHYADSHRGFCLGFERNALVERGTADQRLHSIIESKVSYVERLDCFPWVQGFLENILNHYTREEICEAENFFSDLLVGAMLMRSYSIKSKQWEYEKERRFVRREGGSGTFRFAPSAFKEVIFGLRMAEKDQVMISKLLKSVNFEHVQRKRIVGVASELQFSVINVD